jgi:holo-[acyl-carrier protein] synthase
MAVAGLGTDLSRVSRFQRMLDENSSALIERLFTPAERAYSLSKGYPAPHLAARFAAKEAFLKALGLGLRDGISWQDMSVENDALGKPFMVLSGRAEEIFTGRGLTGLHLSYSHEGDYAAATVILEEQ